jgi:hypothetical protein
MSHRALDKIDTYGARRIIAQLLQLQPVVSQLQRKISARIAQRQAQTLRPLRRLLLFANGQGFDPDTTACLLINHCAYTLKNC